MSQRTVIANERIERLNTIKDWIKDDPKFSRDVLRLVKEIRREQKGKSLLSVKEKRIFMNQLLDVDLDGEAC